MSILRLVVILGVLTLVSGCGLTEPSGPPDPEVIAQALHETYNYISLGKRNAKIDAIQRGKALVSEGDYGPAGTTVFPIRFRYSFTFTNPGEGSRTGVMELRFYLNEFSEWKSKRPMNDR